MGFSHPPAGNGSDGMVEMCFYLPAKMSSDGVLASPSKFLTFSSPLILLQMLLILGTTHALHFILKPFGIHMFVSQALSGVILGQTFLGRFEVMKNHIFPHWSQESLVTVASFGYSMMLFLSAVKMDPGMILKAGRMAVIIGTLCVVVPLAFSLGFLSFIKPDHTDGDKSKKLYLLASVQSFTSFPVVSYVIGELKITNTELGRLGLSAAVFSDFLHMSLIVLLTLSKDLSRGHATKDAVALVIFVMSLALILRPVMRWIIRKTHEGRSVDPSYISIIIAAAFFSQMYFHLFHQPQHLGPFVVGLMVPAGPPLGSTLIHKFEAITLGVVFPITVSIFMIGTDLSLLITEFATIKLSLIIVTVVFGVKLLACVIPSLLSKMPVIDSLALALLMGSKGFVDLGTYSYMFAIKDISNEVLAFLDVFILLNATITPMLVSMLYDPLRKYAGYQPMNIMSLKPNTELRILACIHRPDNVAVVIDLLDVLCPTKESDISVYVLQLIKLAGRANPIFIAHQEQTIVTDSCSHDVVLAFNQYERNNWGTISVHNFTAISPSNLMHEDICTLALDKLASLILIPLHRKWSVDGSIESEDSSLRNLNYMVLEKAPSSVGIFFDRGRLEHRHSKASNLSVCMIFLGGNDDLEALTLARRMARAPSVKLIVVQLLPENKTYPQEALPKVRRQKSDDNENVKYLEQVVKDGPETALIVRLLAEDHDLFVVGRRHDIECPQTVGLSEWSELPELGIIGDLLASRDLNTRASVLIVQQQKEMK